MEGIHQKCSQSKKVWEPGNIIESSISDDEGSCESCQRENFTKKLDSDGDENTTKGSPCDDSKDSMCCIKETSMKATREGNKTSK